MMSLDEVDSNSEDLDQLRQTVTGKRYLLPYLSSFYLLGLNERFAIYFFSCEIAISLAKGVNSKENENNYCVR